MGTTQQAFLGPLFKAQPVVIHSPFIDMLAWACRTRYSWRPETDLYQSSLPAVLAAILVLYTITECLVERMRESLLVSMLERLLESLSESLLDSLHESLFERLLESLLESGSQWEE